MNFIEIVRVADAYHHVDATGIVCRYIRDAAAHDGAVGNDDFLIVGAGENRGENSDFGDLTDLSTSIDHIADVSSRLVVNRASLKTKHDRIQTIIDQMSKAVKHD